jgi:hypothetical protein
MKTATIALLTLCVSPLILAAAETNAPVSDFAQLKPSTDQFIVTLTRGQSAQALRALLKAYWYKPDDAETEAQRLDEAYRDIRRGAQDLDLGRPVPGAYEFLGTRRLGKSLLTCVYVEKHEYGLWPWALTFYKAQDQWRLRVVAFGVGASEDMMAFSVAEPAK